MKSNGKGCLVLFGLLWCSFITVFDFLIARDFVWELRALSLPTTEGTVVQSEMISTRGSKGSMTYRPQITYRFSVDGREVTATAQRQRMTFANSQRTAREVLARYPRGASITVHYDPAQPTRSTYEPGLKPGHLMVALFLTPFHLVGLLLLSPLLPRRFGRVSEPALRAQDDLVVRIALPSMSPVTGALVALGGASFLGTFLTITLGHLTFPKIAAVWALVLAVAAFTFRHLSRRQRSGYHDLVIDATTQTVSLPPMDDRTTRKEVDFAEIRQVRLRHLGAHFSYKGRWGTVTQKSGSPHFELSLVTADEVAHRIARTSDEERLRGVAEKLTQTFGWELEEKTL